MKRLSALAATLVIVGAVEARADCGCSSMTLRWNDGTSGTYCDSSQADPPSGCQWTGDVGAGGCGAEERPYDCTLGPIEPDGNQAGSLGWGFEIVVALTSDSTASDCPEGQANSATIAENGILQPNPFVFDDQPPAGSYSFTGGLQVQIVSEQTLPQYGTGAGGVLDLGSDDFTEPAVNKVYDGQTVRWVDTPLLTVGANESWSEQSQFLSFVNASDGGSDSCWCLFTINHAWDAGEQTQATVTLDQGYGCAIDPAG